MYVVSDPADSVDYVYNDAGVLVSVSRDPDFVGPISPKSVGLDANRIDLNTKSLSPDVSGLFSSLPSFEDMGASISQTVGGFYSKFKANSSRLIASVSPTNANQTEGLGVIGAVKALSGFGEPPKGSTTFSQSVSNTLASGGSFIQSTLLKVIVIVILGIFLVSFLQTKGAQYAK